MRYFLIVFLFSFIGLANLNAQDFLVSPSYNPFLIPGSKKAVADFKQREKLNVLEDSLIYQYDTLKLPFVDDFTSNHLSPRLDSITDPRVTDTTVYQLYINGQKVTDTNAYVTDSTFYYQIGVDSSIISKTELFAGRIQIHDLSVFPTTFEDTNYYFPYNIYDTVNKAVDTIAVEGRFAQDSTSYYFVDIDSNTWYTDRDVYLNETFGIDPPTRGMATFDGLDQYGMPYDIEQKIKVKADYLTSVPIDLSSTIDTTYFSFYFQPKGISLDGPEIGDSLVVEFFNSVDQKWEKTWGIDGFSVDTFQQVMLKVDSQFLTSAFQFRFRAYANAAGAFDQWHIDYIYLNDQRTKQSINTKDIAFVNATKSLLKDYYAMPWWHFKPNPGAFMADSMPNLKIRSLFDGGLNVYNKVVIPDTVNNTNFYRFPANDQFSIISDNGTLTFNYPLNYTFDPNYIDTAGVLSAIADIDFRPSQTAVQDFIRANDTLRANAILDNYYAYDDGTAEAGYGVNPQTSADGLVSYMVQEYNMPMMDSVGGLQLYFLPQRFSFDNNPVTSQSFEITIWNSLNPAQVIYRKAELDKPLYSDDNGFVTYWLDTLIEVPQTFYIGIKAIGPVSLNVGYDLNNNNRNRIFYSLDGQNWYNPSNGIFDGSLMMRPVFRKKAWGVGIEEQKKEQLDVKLYPNPASNSIFLEYDQVTQWQDFQLFNQYGSLVKKGSVKSSISVADLSNGLYILQLRTNRGKLVNKKFLIAK
tara:strand:- start:4042 stop:6285 length:2244 start_codon:yes stop_codon:yes gene_type:complete